MAVFTGAGVRIGEVIAIRVNDVEARDSSPRLRVIGKGGRRRVIPVGPEVVHAVDAYLLSRRNRLGPYEASDELFVRGDGRPFTRGTLDYLVSTWFRRAAVAPPGFVGPRTSSHLRDHAGGQRCVATRVAAPSRPS